MTSLKCNFNSDTTAPVNNEIINAIIEVNHDNMLGYSQDEYSLKFRRLLQKEFSKPIEIHFCVGGAAVNVLALKCMKENYSSIIACDDTHINRYEVGGTEYNTGCKILACDSPDAKLTVDMIKSKLTTKGNFNYSLPRIVVLSQVSELGTCYTCQEIKEICDFCHQNDLFVYIDGARLANALVYLNCSLKEMLEDTGVDVCSFGGNKNGFMFGELLIFLNTSFSKNFILNQKQSMQLFSKSRYLAIQFLVAFEKGIWKKNAIHSNEMALYLKKELNKIGVSEAFPVQSNAVFANFSDQQIDYLKKEYLLSSYDDQRKCCRLMTNWSTTKEEIDQFISYLKKIK